MQSVMTIASPTVMFSRVRHITLPSPSLRASITLSRLSWRGVEEIGATTMLFGIGYSLSSLPTKPTKRADNKP